MAEGGVGRLGGLAVVVMVEVEQRLVEPAIGHPQVEVRRRLVERRGGPDGQVVVEPRQGARGGDQRDGGVGDPFLDVLPSEGSTRDGVIKSQLDGSSEARTRRPSA